MRLLVYLHHEAVVAPPEVTNLFQIRSLAHLTLAVRQMSVLDVTLSFSSLGTRVNIHCCPEATAAFSTISPKAFAPVSWVGVPIEVMKVSILL